MKHKIENLEIKKAKILVVDDLPENIKVLGSILKNEGYNIAVANDGNMALKITKNIMPDLILLDVMMPNMNGFELAEILMNDNTTNHIPIIFITAKTEVEDIVEGLNIGAVDYVTKPFNPTELLARVYNHLELKFSKDLINQQKKELEELNKSKDKFFSIVAHDLKSPFSGFLGLTELLDVDNESMTKEEIKSLSNKMNKAAKNVYSFLENLLEWSRNQMNKIEYVPQELNLVGIVDNLLKIFNETLNHKNIKIDIINNLDNSKMNVFADSYMLNTVIRNLLSNAIKFSHRGSVIEIIYEEFDDKNYSLKIKDFGLGMSQEQIENLFKIDNKFVRKGTDNEKGTGLGLLLCNDFIEKNNGRILVESKIGEGSTFSIILPKYED